MKPYEIYVSLKAVWNWSQVTTALAGQLVL